MITVQLMGGLGNQMFQYALARNLASRQGTRVLFDTTFLDHRLPGSSHVFRNYDLDVFTLEGRLTLLSRSPSFFRNPAYRLQSARNNLQKRLVGSRVLQETRPYQFDPGVLDAPDGVYVMGYWQNERYFQGIRDILKREFTSFRYPLSEASQKLLETIQGCGSICVNFRRTDYVASREARKFHGNTADSFYHKGIGIAAKKVKKPRLFVFSDDIGWCRKNFRHRIPTTFVDETYTGKKYSDYFQLMIACRHFVIPNSTFAWWAAWLSPSRGKIVVAPENWVADPSIDASDFVPQGWIRVKNG